MRPYFEDLANLIPFTVDSLLANKDDLPLEFNIDQDNFVRKNVYKPDIINPDFVKWLKDNLDLTIEKVVLWHWKTDKEPNIAHIDSNPQGEISPGAAINWTLSKEFTSVSWYDVDDVEYRVSMNNEADRRWNTPNVEAYIAIPVKYSDRVAEWSGRGPTLIETSKPHLIYAGEHTRVSISLNFGKYVDFDSVIKKVDQLKNVFRTV